jgi:hypothetical protein
MFPTMFPIEFRKNSNPSTSDRSNPVNSRAKTLSTRYALAFMAGIRGRSGPPGNQDAFRHGLVAANQRRLDGALQQFFNNPGVRRHPGAFDFGSTRSSRNKKLIAVQMISRNTSKMFMTTATPSSSFDLP